MKNKKSLYVLIPLVLLVWGLIFWKFFSVKNPENVITKSFSENVLDKDTSKNSFTINAMYADPFLMKANSVVSIAEKDTKKNRIIEFGNASISRLQNKPDLKYFGCIVCENKKTGLIVLNGINYLTKEQTKVGELFIVTIWKDSLIIKVNEIQHTYYKQN